MRALLLLLLAAACADASSPRPLAGGDGCDERSGRDGGPSSSAADAGPVTGQPSGGYVKLERFTSGDETHLLALAELDAGHTGPGRLPSTFYADFPLDRCFQVPLLPEEPSAYDFVDVGPAIRLDGPAVIELARESLLGSIFYRAAGLPDIAPGDYQVSLGGALRMPPAPVLDELDLADGSVALRWQPVGADHLFFIAQQEVIGRVCHLDDDGAFELPADAAAGVPQWGTAVFLAVNKSTVELDGRAVELVGVQGQVTDYERP